MLSPMSLGSVSAFPLASPDHALITPLVDLEGHWGIRIESTLVVRKVKVRPSLESSRHGWN